MDNGMRIAASGLQAASVWLSATASNIANMRTGGAIPDTPPSQPVHPSQSAVYQPLAVAQSAVPGGGVTASLQASLPSYRLAYDPSAPYANAQGMVAMPEVDLAAQSVQLIQQMHHFRANLAVIKASTRMADTVLDILA